MINNTYTQVKRLIQKAKFVGKERGRSNDIDRYHWVNFIKGDLRIMIIKNYVWYGVFPIIFYTADRAGKEAINFADKSTITDYVNEHIPQDVQEFLSTKCIFLPELYSQQIPYEGQIPKLCVKHFDKDKLKPYSDMIEKSIETAGKCKTHDMITGMSTIIESRWLFGEATNYYLEIARLLELVCKKYKEINNFTDDQVDTSYIKPYVCDVIKMPETISEEDAAMAKQAYVRCMNIMNSIAAAEFAAEKNIQEEARLAYLRQTCSPVLTPILPREIHQSNTDTSGIIYKK